MRKFKNKIKTFKQFQPNERKIKTNTIYKKLKALIFQSIIATNRNKLLIPFWSFTCIFISKLQIIILLITNTNCINPNNSQNYPNFCKILNNFVNQDVLPFILEIGSLPIFSYYFPLLFSILSIETANHNGIIYMQN